MAFVLGAAQPTGGGELIGIKLRIPDDADRQWIVAALDRLNGAGFNLVIVETFYHGYTICPSQTAKRAGFPSQRPAFRGWNPLDVMVREAHSRGMKVYAWVETYYVGNDRVEGPGPILSKKPEWSARRPDGSMKGTGSESDYYFICPANPDARRYIADLYCELARSYALDGLFIDYLRYPVGSLAENPFCFCRHCRSAAAGELGLDLGQIRINPKDPDFLRWTEWRQKQTAEALRCFYFRLKKAAPQVSVTANVHGGYSSDILAHDTLRDWAAWCRDGILDIISTQNYSDDDEFVARQIASDLAAIPPHVPFLPAIKVEDLSRGGRQLAFIRSTRAVGTAYFVYSRLTDDQAKTLAKSRRVRS